jgi:ferredoxin like protein
MSEGVANETTGGKKLSVEARLGLVAFTIDSEPHIKLKEDECEKCNLRYCLFVCPARLYTEEEGKVKFNYEGCLECGTCRIACDKIEWNYPRGGFGAHYQYG